MAQILTTSIFNTQDLYKSVRSILGDKWIEESVLTFFKKRNALSERNIYNSAIQNLEKRTHPLIRDVISQIDTSRPDFDLSQLSGCKAQYELMLLDRDLAILKAPLERAPAVLNDYKNELIIADNYDQRRFEIFVAANYILCGYEVTFLPRMPLRASRTNEFNVRKKGGVLYQIECRQRYQRESDSKREKFLFLLVERIYPKLLYSGNQNLIIKVDWQGETVFSVANELSRLIVAELTKNINISKITLLNKYVLAIKRCSSPLPKELEVLERNIPHFITTQDCYLAVDRGVYLSINRDFNQNTMSKIRSLYQDAKGQFQNQENSIIFIDVGTLPPEIIDEFSNYLKRNLPKEVGALIVLKHQLHINGDRQIVFTPYPQIVLNKKLISSEEDILSMPWSIGETGFDNYIEMLSEHKQV